MKHSISVHLNNGAMTSMFTLAILVSLFVQKGYLLKSYMNTTFRQYQVTS